MNGCFVWRRFIRWSFVLQKNRFRIRMRRPAEQRKLLLEAIRYVDLVIPEENWEQKKTDCKEYHIDTFVIGDDWTGKFDFLKDQGVEVVYLSRTPEISTTQIKHDLNQT